MQNDIDTLILNLPEIKKDWLIFFVEYMRKKHSNLDEVISFQMPTYKLGNGKLRNYISFSTAQKHFSLHSMDFEYISILKEKLSTPGKGKGCVNVKYENIHERQILLDAIEVIIQRNQLVTYGNK